MANLFDKLRLAVGTGGLSAAVSSAKSENESSSDSNTATPASATSAMSTAGNAGENAGTTCLTSGSEDSRQHGQSESQAKHGAEESVTVPDRPSTDKVIPKKTVAKPKDRPGAPKLKKSSIGSSVSHASGTETGTSSSATKAPSKKMKTKITSDSPSAPPKKVAKTEKKKKHKSSALRPPEEEEPRRKKSKPLKPVDARPAFEPLTKPFVIPRRKMSKDVGLFQEVPLDSREYLKDIQPLVMKQYREIVSRGRFLFTKAKLVHNEDLAREFLERKKALKEEGRNDKDLIEHFAFYCVDSENEANDICQNGIFAKGGPTHCLGNSDMGVYLSRHSDIIQRGPMVNGQQGFLIVFKIMKGKVKAMPLNYTSVIEPTPNYDCHVAKDSDIDVLKLGPVRAFDQTQIYIYEYGELDLEKRPKQISPYALIQFVYKDPHKKQVEREPLASMGTIPQRSPLPTLTPSPVTTPSRPSPATTPSRPSPATTPSRQPIATTASPVIETTKATLDAKDYKAYSKHSYRLWKGNLECKGQKAFTGLMVSYASPIVPQKIPEKLNLRAEVSVNKLKSTLPTPIFKPALPIITRQKEVVLDGKHYLYSEMKQIRDKEAEENEDKAKKRSIDSLMKYMLQNSVALKIQLDKNLTLYLLPTSKFTDELGITAPGYPSVLHVLSVSRVPTMTQVTSKGIHLPKDFRMETASNKTAQDHPNRLRDMRRTMLGFFSDQKTIAMGESQKTCRVEMAPEYRTSQSVYLANYTGTAGAGLLPTPAVRTRVPSGPQDQAHMQGGYPRPFHPGNLTIPMSPAQSESGSSQHSTSPLYEPESPHALTDPRLMAYPAKRVGDPRDPRLAAMAYSSTSQMDPRLARSMGAKVPSHPLVQQQMAKAPVTDPRLEQGQTASGEPKEIPRRYLELQDSAVEYAQRKGIESQKKDGHRYQKHQGEKKRRGSERDIDRGVAKHSSKRQRHISEPDYREQVLLQLTQKTLQQLKTDVNNPGLQGTSQLREFHGMMKQQQQVLELQKEMKQLRRHGSISAEGLIKGNPTDLESAYQSKIGELQKTLQSLLQQRQKLASSQPSIDQPHQAASQSAKVSDLLTQVQSLGEIPPVSSDRRMADPRKVAPSDPRKRPPGDPRKVASDPRRTVPTSDPRASLPSSIPRQFAPGDPRKAPVDKPVLLRQISDASQTSEPDASRVVEVISSAPYEVVMEIESPDPEEQMADFNKAAAAGLQGQTKIIPFEKPTTARPVAPPKDFATALVDTTVTKSHPEKTKKKRTPSGDKTKDAAKATTPTSHQKSAVEMLWEKAHLDESMTDASDDMYDPSNPTPTTPTNETVKNIVAQAQESPVSPIREADEMKNFLNSAVETPARVVSSDDSASPAVSVKGNTAAGKTIVAGKTKTAAVKTKTITEKTKTATEKTKPATEKTKTTSEKTKTTSQKTKPVPEKTKTTSEKPKATAEKPSAAAQKKIKSAKDMSSYLNKQLQELEKEKKERNKKKKTTKGKEDDDPQTIEEIDALIMKLHKLKNAKLKEEEQKKQKKKTTPVKPKSKVKASTDDGKENTQPGKKPSPRDPVCGEAPLTRHWGRNAGPVHGIILGPGSNRSKLNLTSLEAQTEDKRKVRISIDGKKMAVEVSVNAKDVKRKKDGLDGSAESCVMYMMHRRFHVESKESENTDDRNFVDSVLESVHSLVTLQESGCNKERQRKVVETAVKLERRKQQSEERMSLESGEEEDDGEPAAGINMFADLDDAQGVSIKLTEDGEDAAVQKGHKVKTPERMKKPDKGRTPSKSESVGFETSLKITIVNSQICTPAKASKNRIGKSPTTKTSKNKTEESPSAKASKNKIEESPSAKTSRNKIEESPSAKASKNKIEESPSAKASRNKIEESPSAKAFRNKIEESPSAKASRNKIEESPSAKASKNKTEESPSAKYSRNQSDESPSSKLSRNKTEESPTANSAKNKIEETSKAFDFCNQIFTASPPKKLKKDAKSKSRSKSLTSDTGIKDAKRKRTNVEDGKSQIMSAVTESKKEKRKKLNKSKLSQICDIQQIQWKPPKDDSTRRYDSLKSFRIPKKSSQLTGKTTGGATDTGAGQWSKVDESPKKEITRQYDSLKSFKIPKRSAQVNKTDILYSSPAKKAKFEVLPPSSPSDCESTHESPLKQFKIPKLSVKNTDVHTLDTSDSINQDACLPTSKPKNQDACLNTSKPKNQDASLPTSKPKNQDASLPTSKPNGSEKSPTTEEASEDRIKAAKIKELKDAIKNLDHQIEVNRALKKLTEGAKLSELKGISGESLKEISDKIHADNFEAKGYKPAVSASEDTSTSKPDQDQIDLWHDLGIESASDAEQPDANGTDDAPKSDIKEVDIIESKTEAEEVSISDTQETPNADHKLADAKEVSLFATQESELATQEELLIDASKVELSIVGSEEERESLVKTEKVELPVTITSERELLATEASGDVSITSKMTQASREEAENLKSSLSYSSQNLTTSANVSGQIPKQLETEDNYSKILQLVSEAAAQDKATNIDNPLQSLTLTSDISPTCELTDQALQPSIQTVSTLPSTLPIAILDHLGQDKDTTEPVTMTTDSIVTKSTKTEVTLNESSQTIPKTLPPSDLDTEKTTKWVSTTNWVSDQDGVSDRSKLSSTLPGEGRTDTVEEQMEVCIDVTGAEAATPNKSISSKNEHQAPATPLSQNTTDDLAAATPVPDVANLFKTATKASQNMASVFSPIDQASPFSFSFSDIMPLSPSTPGSPAPDDITSDNEKTKPRPVDAVSLFQTAAKASEKFSPLFKGQEHFTPITAMQPTPSGVCRTESLSAHTSYQSPSIVTPIKKPGETSESRSSLSLFKTAVKASFGMNTLPRILKPSSSSSAEDTPMSSLAVQEKPSADLQLMSSPDIAFQNKPSAVLQPINTSGLAFQANHSVDLQLGSSSLANHEKSSADLQHMSPAGLAFQEKPSSDLKDVSSPGLTWQEKPSKDLKDMSSSGLACHEKPTADLQPKNSLGLALKDKLSADLQHLSTSELTFQEKSSAVLQPVTSSGPAFQEKPSADSQPILSSGFGFPEKPSADSKLKTKSPFDSPKPVVLYNTKKTAKKTFEATHRPWEDKYPTSTKSSVVDASITPLYETPMSSPFITTPDSNISLGSSPGHTGPTLIQSTSDQLSALPVETGRAHAWPSFLDDSNSQSMLIDRPEECGIFSTGSSNKIKSESSSVQISTQHASSISKSGSVWPSFLDDSKHLNMADEKTALPGKPSLESSDMTKSAVPMNTQSNTVDTSKSHDEVSKVESVPQSTSDIPSQPFADLPVKSTVCSEIISTLAAVANMHMKFTPRSTGNGKLSASSSAAEIEAVMSPLENLPSKAKETSESCKTKVVAKNETSSKIIETGQHNDTYTCKLKTDGIKMMFFKSPPKTFKSPPKINRKDMPNEQLDQVKLSDPVSQEGDKTPTRHSEIPAAFKTVATSEHVPQVQQLGDDLCIDQDTHVKVNPVDDSARDSDKLVCEETMSVILDKICSNFLQQTRKSDDTCCTEGSVSNDSKKKKGAANDIKEDTDLVETNYSALEKIMDKPQTPNVSKILLQESSVARESMSIAKKAIDIDTNREKPETSSSLLKNNTPDPASKTQEAPSKEGADVNKGMGKYKALKDTYQGKNAKIKSLVPKKNKVTYQCKATVSSTITKKVDITIPQKQAQADIVETRQTKVDSQTTDDSKAVKTGISHKDAPLKHVKNDLVTGSLGTTFKKWQEMIGFDADENPPDVDKQSVAESKAASSISSTKALVKRSSDFEQQSLSVAATKTMAGVKSVATNSPKLDTISLNASGSIIDSVSVSSSILDSDSEFVLVDEIKHSTPTRGSENSNCSLAAEIGAMVEIKDVGMVTESGRLSATKRNSDGSFCHNDEWVIVESISEADSEVDVNSRTKGESQVEKAINKKLPKPFKLVLDCADTAGEDSNPESENKCSDVSNIEWLETLPDGDELADIEGAVEKVDSSLPSKKTTLDLTELSQRRVVITSVKDSEVKESNDGEQKKIGSDTKGQIGKGISAMSKTIADAVTAVMCKVTKGIRSKKLVTEASGVRKVQVVSKTSAVAKIASVKKAVDSKSSLGTKTTKTSHQSVKKTTPVTSSGSKTGKHKVGSNSTTSSQGDSKPMVKGTSQEQKEVVVRKVTVVNKSADAGTKKGITSAATSKKTTSTEASKATLLKEQKEVVVRKVTVVNKSTDAGTKKVMTSAATSKKITSTGAKKEASKASTTSTGAKKEAIKASTTSTGAKKEASKASTTSTDAKKEATKASTTSAKDKKPSTVSAAKDTATINSTQATTTSKGNNREISKGAGKAVVARQRHHPYERPKKSNGPTFNQHLIVPELHELMQNFTSASYIARRQDRLTMPKENFFDEAAKEPGRFKDMGETICSGVAIKLNEKKYNTNVHRDTASRRKSRVEALEERLNRIPERRTVSSSEYNMDSEFYGQGPGGSRGPQRSRSRLLSDIGDHFREQIDEQEHQYQIRMQQVQQREHDQAMQLQQDNMQLMQQQQQLNQLNRMQQMQQCFQQNINQAFNRSQWWGNGGGPPPAGHWRSGL
ncbi:uncharacterized protein [Amphiura filiformis]|uniref:uncharacterized protein n=1 Tax=Amphiura filiformis TaxID=82378 RepID=UPI003B2248F0